MRAPEDKCEICSQSRAWHKNHNPRHAFIEPGDRPILNDSSGQLVDEGDKSSVRVMPPADLILRTALIRAGVITYNQLAAIEVELMTTGKTFGGSGGRTNNTPQLPGIGCAEERVD